MNSTKELFLLERLKRHPKLYNRMEALLNVVENVTGDCTKADAAEQYVIEELRKMGSDALHCWAETAVDKATEQTREEQPGLHGNGKKSPLAYLLRNHNGHRAFIALSRSID